MILLQGVTIHPSMGWTLLDLAARWLWSVHCGLKQINSHLVAAAAYPILEGQASCCAGPPACSDHAIFAERAIHASLAMQPELIALVGATLRHATTAAQNILRSAAANKRAPAPSCNSTAPRRCRRTDRSSPPPSCCAEKTGAGTGRDTRSKPAEGRTPDRNERWRHQRDRSARTSPRVTLHRSWPLVQLQRNQFPILIEDQNRVGRGERDHRRDHGPQTIRQSVKMHDMDEGIAKNAIGRT